MAITYVHTIQVNIVYSVADFNAGFCCHLGSIFEEAFLRISNDHRLIILRCCITSSPRFGGFSLQSPHYKKIAPHYKKIATGKTSEWIHWTVCIHNSKSRV